MHGAPPAVSVVLSFRNEAANLAPLVARLDRALARETPDYELIFVNDASTDGSLEILIAERERNPRVKIVNLSRRFGVAEGVLAGMAAASGDAVIYMDADLQDPPELVPALIARWRAGADVVHTVRTRRRAESPLKMGATRLAYRLIRSASSIELAVDAGDFKLLSRRAVDHLLQIRESDPYLRGLVVWLGFTQAFVPYEREARHAGRTHFPLFSRNPWKTFVLGLTSFSFLPIYACAALAALGLVAAAGLLAAAVALAASGSALAAWTAIAGVLLLLWGLSQAAVSAVGLYVIRIYKDVRQRPPYIVESLVGIHSLRTPGPITAVRRTEDVS
jgi:glycosyltransferase involved in cell wall biosynthesis